MSATVRFIIVVFLVLAVVAPWAIGPFIDGLTQFTVAAGHLLGETISHLREGP